LVLDDLTALRCPFQSLAQPGEHILTKESSIGVYTAGLDVDLKGLTESDERVSPLIALLDALEQVPGA
jgi:hypothetical protein